MIFILKLICILLIVWNIVDILVSLLILFYGPATKDTIDIINKNGGLEHYLKQNELNDFFRNLFWTIVLIFLLCASWNIKETKNGTQQLEITNTIENTK